MQGKKRLLIIISATLIVAALILAFRLVIISGVSPKEGRNAVIIPTGSDYSQATDSVCSALNIGSRRIYDLVAKLKKYPGHVKPGRYVFRRGVSYFTLFNVLRSGNQTPVDVTFNNVRTIYQLAGKVGGRIEADSSSIAGFLSDEKNYSADGFTRENIISVFIPDTYEFYWNTTAEGFYSRMLKGYRHFWNDERLRKAKAENMSPADVSTLASIIDEETSKDDEKPRMAGVYINRLKSGMPLQSDPTVKFALNDFSITRILYKHLETDSRYNTYKNTGLPPGPICCPAPETIDAVLDAEKHGYYYFVAKSDFSGYHVFSRTLTEHNHYASEYQKALDKKRIFK